MKELKLILTILETRRDEEFEEADKCRDAGWKFAAQYADGKAAAYGHAVDLLNTYIAERLPWVED